MSFMGGAFVDYYSSPQTGGGAFYPYGATAGYSSQTLTPGFGAVTSYSVPGGDVIGGLGRREYEGWSGSSGILETAASSAFITAESVQEQEGGGPGRSDKPKRKRKTTPQQRVAANIRERRRMCNLNTAFDKLRRRVPAFPHEKRLSRIQTLKLAITYIAFMTEMLHGEDIQKLIDEHHAKHPPPVWQPYEASDSGSADDEASPSQLVEMTNVQPSSFLPAMTSL